MADGHTQRPGQRLLKQPNHGGCGLRIQLPGGLVQKERLRPHKQNPLPCTRLQLHILQQRTTFRRAPRKPFDAQQGLAPVDAPP